jgi:N-acetyl sugar amidotransferase
MDQSDPNIEFDSDGVCAHCHAFKKRFAAECFSNAEGDRNLHAIAEKIKATRRGGYDCVIGLSGGVDSSYVALVLQRLGLRPLAVHLDNGWNAEIAVRNIENIVKSFKIDLVTHVLNWPEFRDLQAAFIRSSVINAEVPTDHAISAVLFKEAARRGLKYIISGSNIVTEAIMPRAWGYDALDWRHINAISAAFGKVRLKTYPHLTLGHWALYTLARGIRFFPILNYIQYDREAAAEELREAVGWQTYGAKHWESGYTKFFQAYILPTKYGVDKRRAHYSTMINSGLLTREEAISRLNTPAYPPDRVAIDKEYFCRKLEIPISEFELLMAEPERSHLDYPNNQYWFEVFSGLVRFAKRKTSGL